MRESRGSQLRLATNQRSTTEEDEGLISIPSSEEAWTSDLQQNGTRKVFISIDAHTNKKAGLKMNSKLLHRRRASKCRSKSERRRHICARSCLMEREQERKLSVDQALCQTLHCGAWAFYGHSKSNIARNLIL